MVVDDDESIRDTLKQVLEFEGYTAEAVADGAEALRWLGQNEAPCVILLDLMMPVMDGWTVLDRLGEDPRLSKIPVVVVTAFGKDIGRAAAYTVLRKPVELDHLLEVVQSHCPAKA